MVSVTLRFNYPGFEDIEDENEVRALLEEMPFDEILSNLIAFSSSKEIIFIFISITPFLMIC